MLILNVILKLIYIFTYVFVRVKNAQLEFSLKVIVSRLDLIYNNIWSLSECISKISRAEFTKISATSSKNVMPHIHQLLKTRLHLESKTELRK